MGLYTMAHPEMAQTETKAAADKARERTAAVKDMAEDMAEDKAAAMEMADVAVEMADTAATEEVTATDATAAAADTAADAVAERRAGTPPTPTSHSMTTAVMRTRCPGCHCGETGRRRPAGDGATDLVVLTPP